MIQHGPAIFRPRHSRLTEEMELAWVQDELAESRRQFDSLLVSLSGLFYRCELEAPWRMSFVSDGVKLLTGYTKGELELKNGWSDIVRPEDRSAVENAVAEAVAERRSFNLAYCIKHKTGESRWVSERGHAIYDGEDKPLFLEGVITDITGCREAEDLQKTALERWKRTLDAIPQMVWTMAGDGTDEFYNAQWFRFTGSRVGSTENSNRAELIHIDDRASALALWRERFTSGEPYEAQYRLKHVGGDYR